jgi:hypothetical protein
VNLCGFQRKISTNGLSTGAIHRKLLESYGELSGSAIQQNIKNGSIDVRQSHSGQSKVNNRCSLMRLAATGKNYVWVVH